MKPHFRTDLRCTREEQQGVVFFRIDDPKTLTSFRLYEIEFVIANKLDGEHTLQEVIDAVAREQQFDLTLSDLQGFVSQLQSLGFVTIANQDGTAQHLGAVSGSAGESHMPPAPALAWQHAQTTDGAFPTTAGAMPAGHTAGDVVPQPATPPTDAPPDEQARELLGLLHSAFAHAAEGFPLHALDYLQATRRVQPQAPAWGTMAAYVEHAHRQKVPAAIDQLWALLRTHEPQMAAWLESYPDATPGAGSHAATSPASTTPAAPGSPQAASAHGAKAESHGGPSSLPPSSTGHPKPPGPSANASPSSPHRPAQSWDSEVRARVRRLAFGTAAGIAGLVAIGAGLWFGGAFTPAAQVAVTRVQHHAVPLFYPGTAQEVAPVRQQWLSFGSSGRVVRGGIRPVGSRVQAGEVVANLELPKAAARKLAQARNQLREREAAYREASTAVEAILAEIAKTQTERSTAEAKLKLLSPKGISRRDKYQKKELEQWMRVRVEANRKLSLLTKQERKPRLFEERALRDLETARQTLIDIENKVAQKLIRAPFAGIVSEIKMGKGRKRAAGQPVVLLQDPTLVRVVFSLPQTAVQQGAVPTAAVGGAAANLPFAPGGEITVAVADPEAGTHTHLAAGKVQTVERLKDGVVLRLHVAEATDGDFMGRPPHDFRLVRRILHEGVYRVPRLAVVSDHQTNQSAIILDDSGKAAHTPVEILRGEGDGLLVRPRDVYLGGEIQLVVRRTDGKDLATLSSGMPLTITGEG